MNIIPFFMRILVTILVASFSIFSFSQQNILVLDLYMQYRGVLDSDSLLNTLLTKGKFYPLSNTEEEIAVITFSLDTTYNTIRFEIYYEKGNNSVIIEEYRALKIATKTKFIYSKFVGTQAFTSQDPIKVFDYDSISNKFSFDSLSSKFFQVQLRDFFLSETPDSIINEYSTHSSFFCNFVYNDDGIAQYLLDDHYGFQSIKDNKWIKGNKITFDWIDDKFIKSEAHYSE